jgi:hypothetical protein
MLTSLDYYSVEKPGRGNAHPALTATHKVATYSSRKRSGGLRTLGPVLGTRLLAILDALRIERATHGVITNTRQVLDAAATNQDDGVFLKVVPDTANIGDDFEAVRQTNLANLAQC